MHQFNKPISSIEPIWIKSPKSDSTETLEFSIYHKAPNWSNYSTYHEYNNIGTKPNDQFQKKRIDSTKIPILKSSENPTKMHKFMQENMKINAKGRV